MAGIQVATWALNDWKSVAKLVPVAEIDVSANIVAAGLSEIGGFCAGCQRKLSFGSACGGTAGGVLLPDCYLA